MSIIRRFQTCTIQIADKTLDCLRWEVERGTYGKLGTARAWTTLSLLQAQNISLPSLQQGTDKIPVSVGLDSTIFGGVYSQSVSNANDDTVEIQCRDYAGALFDAKRPLSDLDLDNVTVSQLVTNIAKQFKYPTDIQISNDPLVGTILEQGSRYATSPRPLWGLLVYLARQVGANINCDDTGKLIMKDQAVNQTLNWVWGPNKDSTDTPIKDLSYIHQPERNKNFTVIVRSHHQQSTEIVMGHVTVAGEEVSVQNQKAVPAGFYTGSGAGQVKSALSSANIGLPVYYFTGKDGLKAAEVQAAAEGIAKEIASRLLVVHATVDGDESIEPNAQLTIQDNRGSLAGFDGKQLFISNVKWTYEPPTDIDAIGEQGFLTHVTAMTTPPPKTDSVDIDTIGGGN